MTLQFGTTQRSAMADVLVTAAAGGSVKLFSGSVPANCAAADPAGLLASGTLPSPALTNTSGTLSKAGTWAFTGSAAGTVASFRLYTSGAVCFCQGTVTASGGGGDMTIDNTVIASGQGGTVNTVSVVVGGA